MRLLAVTLATLAALVALSACSGDDDGAPTRDAGAVETTEPSPPPAPGPTSEPLPTLQPQPQSQPQPQPQPQPRREPRPLRGVDVSHHQGQVDWKRVAGDGISFAYLKATEGSTFSDPRLQANWAGAEAAGLQVGAYHYFTLCSPPEPQADHFVSALDAVGADRRSLPPVVDLELIGNCDPPPERDAMLASARTFIERVEAATGRKVVVYFHPDFEAAYSLVESLGRRLWVRRMGDRPPPGDWWMWQRSDHARVAGIDTPVDLDVLRR